MSTRIVHRPARITTPAPGPEPRTLAAPPPLGDAPAGGMPLQALLPVLGSMSSITMMVLLRSNPLMVVIGAMILVVALTGGVGMALSSRGRQSRARAVARERYLDYLEDTRTRLRADTVRARAEAARLNPDPLHLLALVHDPARLWERRPGDADFLRLRLGVGTVPWFPIQVPTDPNPVAPFDPVMMAEAGLLQSHCGRIAGMPVLLEMARHRVVSVAGDSAAARTLLRSLVSQAAALHSPDELHLAFAIPPEIRSAWPAIELLPHAELAHRWEGPVRPRRIGASVRDLAEILREEQRERSHVLSRPAPVRTLIVVDEGGAHPPFGAPGTAARPDATVLVLVRDRLHEPSDTDVRLRVDADGTVSCVELDSGSAPRTARADEAPPAALRELTSILAPLRPSLTAAARPGHPARVDPADLLEIGALDRLTTDRWREARPAAEFLRVGIGADEDGEIIHLDIKEAAQAGMGPHGICIGATGSGKSEFLRTLVLNLATNHSPEDVSMILVDFKGGAAFAPFRRLPHVAGLIDNLEGEAGLIERARASIAGEVVRRQRMLKDAGSLSSITDYRAARARTPALAPMPHLFLVIDEFGELLTAEPDFVELLLTIGRIGRSIGVHMLLSSQRIESGRLRGLDSYLSYRIGLRTFSEAESHVVLGTPDAFHLPSEPGHGYLKVDTTVYTRFRSGYVSGPASEPGLRDETHQAPEAFVLPETPATAEAPTARAAVPPPRPDDPVLLDLVVGRLSAASNRACPVWLPPLPERLALLPILGDSPGAPGSLHVPVGLIDDPTRQHQGPWVIDLARAGGHHAIIGAPQSGRSTFLRTLTAALSATHAPTRVTVYGLDLTGSTLARLEAFPHVGGVAVRARPDQQTRLLEELRRMLTEREGLFRDSGIESLGDFRARHANGDFPDVLSADVVLLVDGFGLVRTDFEHLEPTLVELLTRGGSFGIHLVVAVNRWADVPMRIQPLIGNRYELRINDPAESTISRSLSTTLGLAGRVLTEDERLAHVALPTADEAPDDLIGPGLSALAERISASWSGPAAAPIRLLPERVEAGALGEEPEHPGLLAIGLRQDSMETELLDLGGRDPHLLVLGDSGSGRTSLLALLADALMQRYDPDRLVVALMEPRRILSRRIPDAYLGGHAVTAQQATALATTIAAELQRRQDGDAPPSPRIVVLADDYDILSAAGAAPLAPLVPYLAQARDLGFSLVLSRPVAGAARGLYENAVQTIKEVGAAGVLLSGERAEGPLWPGVHAEPAIPGRARIIRRGEIPRVIQLAHPVPAEDAQH